MPISNKKLQANRRNAAQSTGPKTPEGKLASSRNATKLGLYAKRLICVRSSGMAHFDHLIWPTPGVPNILTYPAGSVFGRPGGSGAWRRP